MQTRIVPAAHATAHDALLLDLTAAEVVTSRPRLIAACWLDWMPWRPAAVACGLAPYLWREVGLLLAGANPPLLLCHCDTVAAAAEWCRARAVTYRFEAARGRTTAKNPGPFG